MNLLPTRWDRTAPAGKVTKSKTQIPVMKPWSRCSAGPLGSITGRDSGTTRGVLRSPRHGPARKASPNWVCLKLLTLRESRTRCSRLRPPQFPHSAHPVRQTPCILYLITRGSGGQRRCNGRRWSAISEHGCLGPAVPYQKWRMADVAVIRAFHDGKEARLARRAAHGPIFVYTFRGSHLTNHEAGLNI